MGIEVEVSTEDTATLSELSGDVPSTVGNTATKSSSNRSKGSVGTKSKQKKKEKENIPYKK